MNSRLKLSVLQSSSKPPKPLLAEAITNLLISPRLVAMWLLTISPRLVVMLLLTISKLVVMLKLLISPNSTLKLLTKLMSNHLMTSNNSRPAQPKMLLSHHLLMSSKLRHSTLEVLLKTLLSTMWLNPRSMMLNLKEANLLHLSNKRALPWKHSNLHLRSYHMNKRSRLLSKVLPLIKPTKCLKRRTRNSRKSLLILRKSKVSLRLNMPRARKPLRLRAAPRATLGAQSLPLVELLCLSFIKTLTNSITNPSKPRRVMIPAACWNLHQAFQMSQNWLRNPNLTWISSTWRRLSGLLFQTNSNQMDFNLSNSTSLMEPALQSGDRKIKAPANHSNSRMDRKLPASVMIMETSTFSKSLSTTRMERKSSNVVTLVLTPRSKRWKRKLKLSTHSEPALLIINALEWLDSHLIMSKTRKQMELQAIIEIVLDSIKT